MYYFCTYRSGSVVVFSQLTFLLEGFRRYLEASSDPSLTFEGVLKSNIEKGAQGVSDRHKIFLRVTVIKVTRVKDKDTPSVQKPEVTTTGEIM